MSIILHKGRFFVSGLFLGLSLLSGLPLVTVAQMDKPLVPCGTEVYKVGDPETVLSSSNKDPVAVDSIKNPCGWNDLIVGITNITNYLIILGAAFSAVAFGWAGFLMMTAAGEMSKIEHAKSIFGKVVVGFLIMLSAWLIVHAIEAGFIAPESGINSLLGS